MYEIRTIHSFDNNTSTGIDQVPLNGYVIIDNLDGTGKPKFFRLISKAGLSNTTTIRQFLALDTLYEPLQPDLVPQDVLSAVKVVDGAGSGLSADDVDGIEGADIATLSAAQIIDGAKTFNSALTVNNDIVVTGTVDGVDIAAFKASYDNLDYKTYLSMGTITSISIGISSDGSIDDVVLPTANDTQAGLLSAALYNEIITNTGTVLDVTAGAGMIQSGTDSLNPSLDIVAGDNSITVNPDNIVVNIIDCGEF